MKLSDGIVECPDQGQCKIDINKIVRCWQKNTFVSRWHDEYRLCSGTKNKQIKVAISEKDALAIIEKLDLVKVQIKPFAHGWSYMTKERLQRYNKAMKVPDLVMEVMFFVTDKKQGLDEKETKKFHKSLQDCIKRLW